MMAIIEKAAIEKAAVIGAGTMGAGIAAQFANAGIPVLLLDIALPGAVDRRASARQAIERQLKFGGFMHPSAAALVEPGNVEDDLALVADADWIVEAVIEDPAVKQALFAKLETIRKPGSIVSSNTSTISRARLCQGLPESFARDFVVTHFFNPPRHMRLLELVGDGAGSGTRAAEAGESVLGKTVIRCRDTPGFIANRLGCYWMAMAASEAIAQGLTVEAADAVLGAPFGVPRTGVFGLFDLVGVDLVPSVWGSLVKALPADDDLHRYDITLNAVFNGLIEAGRFGKKSKAGFYRPSPRDRNQLEAIDFATFDYRAVSRGGTAPQAASDLQHLCESADGAGRYAWTVLKRVIGYASAVAPDIADEVASIDTAMQLGYGWRRGPFALADRLGVPWIVDRMTADGEAVPPLLARAARDGGFYRKSGRVMRGDGSSGPAPRPTGGLSLATCKESGPPVFQNASAALWDIGEGVVCLEVSTKMNVVDDAVLDAIDRALEVTPKGFQALVVGNDDPRAFSAGANLEVLLDRIERQDFAALRAFVARGQGSFRALKYAPFPVVGAAFGLALGGGCELLLHCDAIVAHAELTAGLPEANVGLIPAWGGGAQLLQRLAGRADKAQGPVAVASQAFDLLASAKTSQSALDARVAGFLRPHDVIVMNRAHLLARAQKEVLRLAPGYRAPAPGDVVAAGPTGFASLRNAVHGECQAGRMTLVDAHIRTVLARVLTGGEADAVRPIPETEIYALELEGLVELAGAEATRERIRHLLTKGSRLRD